MDTELKSLVVEKMDDAGQGLARIATLSAIDHDGDTYSPGAFSWKDGGEQWVPILPAHMRSEMPLGKARVYEDGDAAFAELHLNMDATAGQQWHSQLKFDLATGKSVQEWSYGFGTIDAAFEQRGTDRVRVLRKLDVYEVSPVIRGAGIGTATLDLKSRGSFAAQLDAIVTEIDDIVERGGGIRKLRETEGRAMSKARIAQLVAVKARLDELIGSCGDRDPDEDASRAEAERLAAQFFTGSARRRMRG